MDDTSAVIREQMEETKTQLSEKLESLEQQVADTVQSTGNAVNATVETVQETIDSVTTTVKIAVQSVVNAFDIRRQVERHPWVVMGGAVALGYLARELLMRPDQPEIQMPKTFVSTPPVTDNGSQHNQESASWSRLQTVAIGSFLGIASEIATRAVPAIVDYLAGNGAVAKPERPSGTSEQERSPNRSEI
jgi:ElaB/YqjD/DUF883 family membrane-anchored ribosome-binding protein